VGESEVEKLAEHMHFAIFPEEYDHFYDSEADTKKRQAGISPLSEKYIGQVNERRKTLGFEPYDPIALSSRSDTKAWVKTLIREGRAPELAQYVVKVQAEPLSRVG
jgi:hypothetical protein